MSVQTFTPENISRLKKTLVNSAEAGKPQDYEIRVDDMKVVPRTNDVEQFDNYEEFITNDTKKIVVLVYDGSSRRNEKYNFLCKEESKEKPREKGLSGTEVKQLVSQELEQEKKQWKYELLEKELKDVKKKFDEAEEYIGTLTSAIKDLKEGRKMEDIKWGELAGVALEGVLRRNTHLIAKVPGMQGLAGIIEQDTKQQEKQLASPHKEPEMEASFEMKKGNDSEKERSDEKNDGGNQNENYVVSKDDKGHVDFLRQLQQRFDKEQLGQIITLLNMFVDKPQAIIPAIMLTKEWDINPQPKKKTETNQEKKKAEPQQQFKKHIPETKLQTEKPEEKKQEQKQENSSEEKSQVPMVELKEEETEQSVFHGIEKSETEKDCDEVPTSM